MCGYCLACPCLTSTLTLLRPSLLHTTSMYTITDATRSVRISNWFDFLNLLCILYTYCIIYNMYILYYTDQLFNSIHTLLQNKCTYLVVQVMRRNEQMLQESRNTITIPSSFLLRILAYLNRSGRSEHMYSIIVWPARPSLLPIFPTLVRSAQEQQQSELS